MVYDMNNTNRHDEKNSVRARLSESKEPTPLKVTNEKKKSKIWI